MENPWLLIGNVHRSKWVMTSICLKNHRVCVNPHPTIPETMVSGGCLLGGWDERMESYGSVNGG